MTFTEVTRREYRNQLDGIRSQLAAKESGDIFDPWEVRGWLLNIVDATRFLLGAVEQNVPGLDPEAAASFSITFDRAMVRKSWVNIPGAGSYGLEYILGTLERIINAFSERVLKAIRYGEYSDELIEKEINQAAMEANYIFSMYK